MKEDKKVEIQFKKAFCLLTLLFVNFPMFGIKLSEVKGIEYLSNYNELKNIETARILEGKEKGERRNGLAYVKGENTPFTGVLIARKNKSNIIGIYFYKNGQLQDVSNDYYENGQLYIWAKNINDKAEGEGYEYYPNGKLREKRFYKNDIVVESTSYHPNGKLWKTLKSIGGLKAIITGYYDNGVKNSTMSIIQDYSTKGKIKYIMDGESIAYDKKGQVLGIINYKDNKTTGLKQQAFKNGKLKYEYISASDKLEDLKMQDYYIEYFDNSEQIKLNCNELSKGNWRCKEYNKNGNFKREFDSPTFRSPNDWSFGINALLGIINILF